MKALDRVSPPCVVALTWTLKDTLGEVLDELESPVEFMVGGDDLLESIEAALDGQPIGAEIDLHLEPEQAFGDYDEQLVFLQPRAAFPAELEEGMSFEAGALPRGTSGMPSTGLFVVSGIYPEHIILDGNHPLAGMALRLRMAIGAIREATREEAGRRSAGAGFFQVLPQAPEGGLLH